MTRPIEIQTDGIDLLPTYVVKGSPISKALTCMQNLPV